MFISFSFSPIIKPASCCIAAPAYVRQKIFIKATPALSADVANISECVNLWYFYFILIKVCTDLGMFTALLSFHCSSLAAWNSLREGAVFLSQLILASSTSSPIAAERRRRTSSDSFQYEIHPLNPQHSHPSPMQHPHISRFSALCETTRDRILGSVCVQTGALSENRYACSSCDAMPSSVMPVCFWNRIILSANVSL